jgi:hypothetical protein
VARPGDAVAVTLYNNPGGGAFGPSTGMASRIPSQSKSESSSFLKKRTKKLLLA